MTEGQTPIPQSNQGGNVSGANQGNTNPNPSGYRQNGQRPVANPMNANAGARPMYAPRPAGAPIQPQAPLMPVQYEKAKGSAAKGFAIAGFILALIGLFVVVWQYNRYLNPFGTVGLVMSVVGLLIPEKGEDRNRITYIFAVVGIIISVLVLIATLIIGIFDLQPFVY
ncbi:hypothetical protein [Bifidobacterium crudilactis]|jgi:hypothetical protein|uniref:hypothetical protein n=1 Tax=Bifidobacterium crudilactis TaxID=327277 RepID=UPI002F35A279|nr:hypothetical protein [Bifidobacterium crudilactis]